MSNVEATADAADDLPDGHDPTVLTEHDADLEVGQRVRVDWSEGNSPIEEFTGTIRYATDGHQTIIHVEADDGTYPDDSLIWCDGIHDAAPEWVEPLD
jgi:hypothetical protein